ncbi:hypothetical protein AA0119_g13063 [Alternaria tenuissima]|uniref:Peptidase C14 caspase domain-containing protein n=1 Tax=Alternaria tenuissima TaxID=119927 RepID=A0ABY0FSS7_9PLEO|nr:hypothetical protein AA0119_g13063 [Alternaria tenuissima]RYO03536.1 hypothetical protein AA0121_g13068 [Alternaria tenuissima]
MDNTSSEATTHWAVVIGVNYYPGSNSRNLKGCVRDAIFTKLYLEDTIKSGLDIVVFTASTPSVDGTPPPEKPEAWPTYHQVECQLKRIIENSKSGDHVYIHYSGHGTRVNDKGRCYLALLLLDDDGCKSKYFRTSRNLAPDLQKMVEKGLRVTLVLDCCFSGRVARNTDYYGFDVRYLEYDPIPDSAAIDEEEATPLDTMTVLRDGSTETDWLINPAGYTILSACAPDQNAFEIEVNENRQGALTHFLLRALNFLKGNGINLTHRSLHEHISVTFHARWPQQTPMRYGNANLTLFGNSLFGPENDLIPLYEKDGQLRLRAGDIHGVFTGDEYVAYPFNTPEHASSRAGRGSASVRVANVGPFESDLIVIDPEIEGKIETGWKAHLLTGRSPRAIRVRAPATFNRSGLTDFLDEDLRYVRLITRQEDKEHPPEEPCMYHVVVTKNGEYRIVDALLQPIPSVPAVSCNSDGAQKTLVDVLQHMAKFKYFEAVENRIPCETFQTSFFFTSNHSATNSNWIEMEHGAIWNLTMKNTSDKPLYVAIFNFRPSWEVTSLTSRAGGGDFCIVSAKEREVDGEYIMGIRMKVPEFLHKDGVTECEDHFKVFITSRPISFHMTLPDIFRTARGEQGVLRGSDDPSGLLEELDDGFRAQDDNRWTTQSFLVRTSIRQSD